MPPADNTSRELNRLLDAGSDDHPAVVSADGSLSYRELRSWVRGLSARLDHAGLGRGDRALVVLSNGPAFPAALFAVWRAGAVAVPMDARSPAEQLLRIARDCRATAILCDGLVLSRLERRLRELPAIRIAVVDRPRPTSGRIHFDVIPFDEAVRFDGPAPEVHSRPRDLAALMYTSGSTGRPKGVMHSHASLLSSLDFTRDHVGIRPDDRVLVGFPLYHLFSFRVLLTHLMVGATVIAATDILAGLKRADRTCPNALILVPAACSLIVKRFAPVLAKLSGTIVRVSIGSAAISPMLLEEIQRLLPDARVFIPYGMTEARIGFLEAVEGRRERRLCAADPNLEVQILDEEGGPVLEGVGELVLRGSALMLGYWHNRDCENEQIAREGFRTRDLMEVRADGSRYLVGRLDDVISVGGEKVFPTEVEGALLAHPRVRDARVVGQPDPRGVRGQVVKASVVMGPGAEFDAEDILSHCRAYLEPYKIPALVEPVPEIARNNMGKVTGMARS